MERGKQHYLKYLLIKMLKRADIFNCLVQILLIINHLICRRKTLIIALRMIVYYLSLLS